VTDHHVARGDGRPQVGGEPAQELFQPANVDSHHDSSEGADLMRAVLVQPTGAVTCRRAAA
jgi:hypothetical protein